MSCAADIFAGQRVAVFGLGRSGISCGRALMAGGADVLAWDDGAAGRAAGERAGLPLADLREVDFATLAALVLAPGVPFTHPEPHWTVKKAQAAGVEIICDVEVFFRQLAGSGARLVAVTGTNGKSTTTALIGHVLRHNHLDAHIGGNIGKPVFDLPPPAHGRIYVVETSSYQIDLSPTLRPDVGVLLNVSPDHLDRHGDMDNYAAVKGRLFAHMGGGDTAVISVDDAYSRRTLDNLPRDVAARPVSVETMLDDGVCVLDGVLHERAGGKTLKGCDLSLARALQGRHNWQNAAAAWAACRALRLDGGMIAGALGSFPGLAHRMELVAESGGVRFVNDSKATNADAAARALSTFEDIFWLAGGRAKQGGIAALGGYAPRIRQAFLFGEAAGGFAASLRRAGVAHQVFERLDDAFAAAASAAAELATATGARPVVLLAPAAASFDHYASFEARGEHFRRLAEAVAAAAPRKEGETACD